MENDLIVQQEIISQIREIMNNARQNVAAQVNNEQMLAYWNIGHIIVAHEFFSGLFEIPVTDWKIDMDSLL